MSSMPPFFLIDNDEEDQEIFTMALHEANPESTCECASSGYEALQKLQADPGFQPLIIFIDMNMPLMDGMECLREIKNIDRLAKTPIYMYSTAADPKTIERAQFTGATGFIIKPGRFSELTTLLKELIDTVKEMSHAR